MNNESKAILEKAGWYEGRKVDLTETKKSYEKYGKSIFKKAENFLMEFDGIEIDYRQAPTARITPPSLFKDYYLDGIAEDLEIVLGENVLIIGFCLHAESDLYISESGNIYTDYGLIGDNPYDFWDYILKTFTIHDKNNKLVTWKELGIEKDLKRVEHLLYKIEYAKAKGLPLEEYLEELKTYKK